MESSLRLESERICFESRNLISLISNKSSHLEGMALTRRCQSTKTQRESKFPPLKSVVQKRKKRKKYWGLF